MKHETKHKALQAGRAALLVLFFPLLFVMLCYDTICDKLRK